MNHPQEFFVDFAVKDSAQFTMTKSGLLRVKGAIARTGVMEYINQDGGVYYQYVPPDTLFDSKHLESLAGLPVTLHHPEEVVTPKNYKQYAVGSVGDRITANLDKGLVEVVFTIGDEEAIEAATKGNINQISCGYWARLIPDADKPDTYIQIERAGNHIALVDEARGGDQLKLNLDSYNVNTKLIETKPEITKWRTLYVTV